MPQNNTKARQKKEHRMKLRAESKHANWPPTTTLSFVDSLGRRTPLQWRRRPIPRSPTRSRRFHLWRNPYADDSLRSNLQPVALRPRSPDSHVAGDRYARAWRLVLVGSASKRDFVRSFVRGSRGARRRHVSGAISLAWPSGGCASSCRPDPTTRGCVG
jgi:hypothetical protein